MNAVIKVCGITSTRDAAHAFEAGATSIGLNIWPQSPRSVSIDKAIEIATAVRGRGQIVVVSVNDPLPLLQDAIARIKPDAVQLHGDEPDAMLTQLGPSAYKAVGLATLEDVVRALSFSGAYVLVDARDEVRRGGTGVAPPSGLVERVCRVRPTILAGGLGPDNVENAIATFVPAGVDAASRLETSPGHKDPALVESFVKAARRAFEALHGR